MESTDNDLPGTELKGERGSLMNSDRPNTSITDPTGRFERSNELLGRGASKEVYKAFDQEEGVEVAWNQLKVDNLTEQSAAKILSEIQILTQLDNENTIRFYHSWLRRNSAGYYEVYFITELMTSGTLKNYLQKTKGNMKLKVVKNWCRQILRALNYLHTKTPPIIHRDLKCDNIFVNGNNGQVKLGDFGLAVLKNREMLTSVLGTPEFMAPELYEESYDEKVDVYAFGLCLLEMVTRDYPYSECDNAAQIYRKVTQGIKPMAIQKVTDPETRNFIELCIDPDPHKRPTVEELLVHEFMTSDDTSKLATPSMGALEAPHSPTEMTSISPIPAQLSVEESMSPVSTLSNRASTPPEARLANCQVEVISVELPVVHLKMKLLMTVSSANKEVKFPFNFENDTISTVVDEMIREFVLPEYASEMASSAIRDSLKDPLSTYEMTRANVPVRAEMSQHAVSTTPPTTATTTATNTAATTTAATSAIAPTSGAAVPILPNITQPNSSQATAQTGGSSPQAQTLIHADDLVATSPCQSAHSNTTDVSEPGEADLVIIENHPEVAALLLKQKKEIELLALFHRREHQTLLRNLRRQIKSRSDSTCAAPTPPPQRSMTMALPTTQEFEEEPFMSKVRQLMYESTGNAAWLPNGDGAPTTISNSFEPMGTTYLH